jgi:hypothetical protein
MRTDAPRLRHRDPLWTNGRIEKLARTIAPGRGEVKDAVDRREVAGRVTARVKHAQALQKAEEAGAAVS